MLEPENIFNWNMALDHSRNQSLLQKNHVNPLNPFNHGSDSFCKSQAPLRSCLRQKIFLIGIWLQTIPETDRYFKKIMPSFKSF